MMVWRYCIIWNECGVMASDRHRFHSQSMAKTITATLMGVAVAEGAIKSIDDTVAIYVPRLVPSHQVAGLFS